MYAAFDWVKNGAVEEKRECHSAGRNPKIVGQLWTVNDLSEKNDDI